ncbi:MAG: hypothetical protein ABI675_15180 [Chitinophagaceae bacterium]
MKQLSVFKALLCRPILISLFDYSGIWSEPYRKAGYRVLQVDKKLGFDIYKWSYRAIKPDLVGGILAAPPCTDFAGSGAQYWSVKDKNGQTNESVRMIKKILEIVKYFNPGFWVIENPVGRLNDLIPELKEYGPWYWQPFWYGDAWSKKTGLWGKFNPPKILRKVTPARYSSQGSWIQKLGGKSETTKELRSITPPGFALAFFKANPLENHIENKSGSRYKLTA